MVELWLKDDGEKSWCRMVRVREREGESEREGEGIHYRIKLG